MTPRGQWTGLRAAWDDAESLIRGGGVAVFTATEDGHMVEVANTGYGDMVATSPVLFRGAFEGSPGGLRAPAPNPDDDGDGAVDEDRLDGIDNDGDGHIDEDFSAIGDEMIVSAYRTRAGAETALAFHQEVYAWSLPHIEQTIMLSLTVRNVGERPVTGVRVAVYYGRDGSLGIVRHSVGDVAVVSSRSDAGTGLMLVPLTRSKTDAGWTNLVVEGPDAGGRPLADTPVMDESDLYLTSNGATIYCLSPVLGDLAPGEQARIDVGIVVVSSFGNVAEAADLALETYKGVGDHRYLPPPVAIKPRVLWGYYRPLPGDEPGVWLDFDVAGQSELDDGDFAYFSGVDQSSLERLQIGSGHTVLALRGPVGEGMLRSSERVTLKGRLASGEFFEANFRPYHDDASPEVHHQSDGFWATPGKLTQQLLKASPNPFRDATMIGYEIPAAIQQEDGSQLEFAGSYETTVKVYNVAGRLVSTLVDGLVSPGTYTVDWPALDDSGNPVASGVYYLKLQIENRFITKRLIVLK